MRIYKEEAREKAVIELYLARNLPESRQYICRNIVQSRKIYPVRIEAVKLLFKSYHIHLFVEHTIVFVDICDVAFFLVETLPRKFAFLVNAKEFERYQSHVQSKKKKRAGDGDTERLCQDRKNKIKDRRTPY